MTNPFANAAASRTATPPTQPPAFQAPATTTKAAPPAKAAEPETGGVGFGDPFAEPAGLSTDRITDMLGSLLLVRPTEYIEEMSTSSGDTDAVRADIAILDETEEPGRVAEGVLIFQMALKRDLRKVMKDGMPFLLGRLQRGQAKGNKSAPYLFARPTDEDKALAHQFIKAVPSF